MDDIMHGWSNDNTKFPLCVITWKIWTVKICDHWWGTVARGTVAQCKHMVSWHWGTVAQGPWGTVAHSSHLGIIIVLASVLGINFWCGYIPWGTIIWMYVFHFHINVLQVWSEHLIYCAPHDEPVCPRGGAQWLSSHIFVSTAVSQLLTMLISFY